ncbi:MAG: hypothetical protein RLZZ453_609 [Chlamydiota bacterium]|jgi:hypothetical protein
MKVRSYSSQMPRTVSPEEKKTKRVEKLQRALQRHSFQARSLKGRISISKNSAKEIRLQRIISEYLQSQKG